MGAILAAIVIIIVDQGAKYYIKTHIVLGVSIPVIANVFHITYVLNPGAAFGMFRHKTGFFIGVAFLMLLAAGYFYRRIPSDAGLLKRATVLLAGGAAGNVLDRIQTGQVIDFFDFRIWPVFNVADCAIVLGVALMLYNILFYNQKDDVN